MIDEGARHAGTGTRCVTLNRSWFLGAGITAAADMLKLSKERIAFVAFAGWDVAGAKWLGYPTSWNNRQTAARETPAAEPGGAGATLDDLLSWLGVSAAR